jgi:hypothetical protein
VNAISLVLVDKKTGKFDQIFNDNLVQNPVSSPIVFQVYVYGQKNLEQGLYPAFVLQFLDVRDVLLHYFNVANIPGQ